MIASVARVLALAGLVLLLAAPAARAEHLCAPGTHISGLGYFHLYATKTKCKVAKRLARTFAWDDPGHMLTWGRPWRCRIVQQATGTDPGLNPYTKVRCRSGPGRVRFWFRS